MLKNLVIWLVIGLVLMTVFNQFNTRQTTQAPMEYSQFLEEVKAGRIAKVTIVGRQLKATTAEGKRVTSYSPGDIWLVSDLLKYGVKIEAKPEEEPSLLMNIFVSWFPMLLLIGVATGYSIAMLFLLFPLTTWAIHGTGITLRDFWRTLGTPALAAVTGAAAGLALKQICGGALPPLAFLILGSAVVMLVFAVRSYALLGPGPLMPGPANTLALAVVLRVCFVLDTASGRGDPDRRSPTQHGPYRGSWSAVDPDSTGGLRLGLGNCPVWVSARGLD